MKTTLLLIGLCVSQANNGLAIVSSYPLYCQGPLVTSSGTNPLTPFKWSSEGAEDASPGPGECAWADRGPRGTEIKSGGGSVISGALNEVANLPAGEYAKIGVHHDQESHDMVVTRVFGLVTPPFNAVPEGIQAYIPSLTPLTRVQLVVAEAAKEIPGVLHLLMTIDATGKVTEAEVLTGPEALRQAAIDAVKQQRYRPVLRDGRPVSAYIGEYVTVMVEGKSITETLNIYDEIEATHRLHAIERRLPRSPAQILADREQDAGGGDDDMRRFYALADLAKAALRARVNEKAADYANELLRAAPQHPENWNYGNAIHDCNLVLGLVAVRQGDIEEAGNYLLAAGDTPGSPSLDSFGPDMSLAKALLEQGERDKVLQYFARCRSFWQSGRQRLDEWSETVRGGGMPDFKGHLQSSK